MKIYGTGTSGTLGKHLPKSVAALNINLASGNKTFNDLKFERVSNLLHLAGIVGPSEVLKDVDYARAVNINGTLLLAEEFLKKSEGIFYYVSTSHVYAYSEMPLTESSPLGPANVYAEQKLEAEESLLGLFRHHQNRLCIVRLFSVLDWDVAPFTLGGAIRNLIEPESKYILSNASDVRDFLTPKTIAETLYQIATKSELTGVTNLCSSNAISVGKAAIKMLTESGIAVPNNRIVWSKSSNPLIVGDNSTLLLAHPDLKLTWKPSKRLLSGL